MIHYLHEKHDTFMTVCTQFDALILRCNSGHIVADGGSQKLFDDSMEELQASGVQVLPSPHVMRTMGAKDALTRIAGLSIGLPDTFSYFDRDSFAQGFKKNIAYQPRVVKQNRGSSGEGIWIARLKSANYCATLGDRVCDASEALLLTEANDMHTEEHTVEEFLEFCDKGTPAMSPQQPQDPPL